MNDEDDGDNGDDEDNIEGEMIAFHLADALYHLGFPWDKIGEEGLKITDRFVGSEAREEVDEDITDGMRRHFDGIKNSPGDTPPLTLETMPSEYMVIDELIAAFEDLAGDLPWVAEPIFEVFDDYEKYLESIKASKKLKERLRRLNSSLSDLETRASGRG